MRKNCAEQNANHNSANGITIFCLTILVSFLACSKGSTIKGSVIDLCDQQPVNGIQIIARTQSDIESEMGQIELVTTTSSEGNFILENALPGKHYTITAQGPNILSEVLTVEAPVKGESRLIKQNLRIVRAPGGNGICIVRQYGSSYEQLPNLFFPYGLDDPPENGSSQIPRWSGEYFLNTLGWGFGKPGKGFAPVTGMPAASSDSDREYISFSRNGDVTEETIYTFSGEVAIIKVNGRLKKGLWAIPITGYGNAFVFEVVN